MKFLLDKYYEKTKGYYPFFKYCPRQYWDYYIAKRAKDVLGYEYDYKNPKTLNEKIRWLIYNEKLDLKTKLTDKILVKGYIASKLGIGHYAELYGVYDDFEEIDFSILPNQFALKANHGWRMNTIVHNKNTLLKSYDIVNKATKKWMKANYEEWSAEPQYRNIKRKLLVEFLRPVNAKRNELQIYCFNGEPAYCEIRDCSTNFTVPKFFDIEWKQLTSKNQSAYNKDDTPRPEVLDELCEYSKILSKEFSFVRIDFSTDMETPHVVEMTFTPHSAMIPFGNKDIDLMLGERIILPIQPKERETNVRK